MKLSDLSRGQSARVSLLAAEPSMRRRFRDLGLIEGTLVECLGPGPLGDPCAYLIRGAVIALRNSDAAFVSVGLPLQDPAGEPEQAVRHGAY